MRCRSRRCRARPARSRRGPGPGPHRSIPPRSAARGRPRPRRPAPARCRSGAHRPGCRPAWRTGPAHAATCARARSAYGAGPRAPQRSASG
ncbi:hypothetical protein [Ornithinimicrobium kibberense]|uniref:hypothetical protein n=1 Tax=Ornithinimicrobium kibberense TaxID=282060 RepID=UPI0036206E2E